MRLLIGLGNPGGQYERNRHNVGFMAIDHIADALNASGFREKHGGAIAELRHDGETIYLFKPMSFMNRSGQPVGELARYFKISLEEICVFHDELDLAPGRIRVKRGGGHAGHNGLRSIDAHIGNPYARIRLGIGHPGRKELVAPYVLHDFGREDEKWLAPLLAAIGQEAKLLISGELEKFQNKVASTLNSEDTKNKIKPEPRQKLSSKAPQPSSKQKEERPSHSPFAALIDKFRR